MEYNLVPLLLGLGPSLLLGPIGLAALGFFYFYKLDEIPGLKFRHTILFLILSRVADFGTFLWVSEGRWTPNELNYLYQFLALRNGHLFAALVSQVVATSILALIIWWTWFRGASDRFTFAVVSTVSAVSIYGALSNLAFAFGLPLLVF